MEKEFLERCLAEGLSLEAIGERVEKHPSTVGYWLKKHGLTPVGSARHAPKGNVDETRLRELVEEGSSIRTMAEEIGAGYSTIRHWLSRLRLETDQTVRTREARQARRDGLRRPYLNCPTHGRTAFLMRSEGGYRCAKCNSAAVSERRRQIKRQLVEEAGGKCGICGFSGHPSALQFHHLNPEAKEFHLSQYGHSRGIDRVRTEAENASCYARTATHR